MTRDKSYGLLKRIFGKSNKEKKIEMINSVYYMEWLIGFTERFPAWRDDMAKNEIFNISNADKKNMEKLGIFFEIIHNYAYKNGIRNYICDKEIFYFIKINNYGLQIGKVNGIDGCYYCQRERVRNSGFIDFGNIRGYEGIEIPKDYKKELEKLENMMLELYQKRIPILAIEDTTKKVLKKIKVNSEGVIGKNE